MKRILGRVMGVAVLGVLAGVVGCSGSAQRAKQQQEAKDVQMAQLIDKNYKLEQDLAAERARVSALMSQVSAADRGPALPARDPAAGKAPARGGKGHELSEGLRGKGVQQVKREGHTAYLLPGGILFSPGHATLSAEAKATLKQMADHIRQETGGRIRVDGHTDSDPIVKARSRFSSNQQLSEARAKAVRDYLVTCGIERGRFEVVGHGADKPLASNKTPDGKRQNRRVELVLLGD